ncbi:H-NS histone family protein [Roseomonas sp. WA12]
MAKPDINLDKLTVPELTQLIEEAKAALNNKRGEARSQLVEEMTAKARQLGLDLSDLITSARTNVRKSRSDKGAPVAAKYRNETGETWSGRGRMPKWLSEAVGRGRDKEDFLA